MRSRLFMLAVVLLLCGCSTTQPDLVKSVDLSRLAITPVQGGITPRYREGNGVLTISEGLELGAIHGNPHSSKLLYSIRADGENLVWALTFTTREGGYSAIITTTRAGMILTSTILGKDGPQRGKSQPEAIQATNKLFYCCFAPLVENSVSQNGVVSPQPPLFFDHLAKGELAPKDEGVTTLAGQTVYEGIPCYVLRHHTMKQITLKTTREQVGYTSDGYLLVNSATMLPVIGEEKVGTSFQNGQLKRFQRIRRIAAVPK